MLDFLESSGKTNDRFFGKQLSNVQIPYLNTLNDWEDFDVDFRVTTPYLHHIVAGNLPRRRRLYISHFLFFHPVAAAHTVQRPR